MVLLIVFGSAYASVAPLQLAGIAVFSGNDHKAFLPAYSHLYILDLCFRKSGYSFNTVVNQISEKNIQIDRIHEIQSRAVNNTGKLDKDLDVKFWYNGNGTADFSLENHEQFRDLCLSEMPERFRDGDNYAWISFRGGAHAYNAWLPDLYNSLLVFFTK